MEIKRQGCEANLSPPPSTDIKKNDLFLHYPISLHGVVLITRDNFTLPYHMEVSGWLHTSAVLSLNEKPPSGIRPIGYLVDPRPDMDVMEKRKVPGPVENLIPVI